MRLQGLWKGLGGELGARVKPEEIEAGSRGRIRLKKPELVKIYMRLYRPRELILIARCETPSSVKDELEFEGIEVIDNVKFDRQRLKNAAEKLLEYAKPMEDVLIFKGELARIIKRKSEILGKTQKS